MGLLRVDALFAFTAAWTAVLGGQVNSVSAADTANFYVSPCGNDAWSGTVAAPNDDRSDGPVATIERARGLVRELRAAQPMLTRPVIVSLRGGVYELAETLKFSCIDGGTLHSPTCYVAYENETPILSGGVAIRKWRVGKDRRWRVTLPSVASGKWTFSQLFVDNQRRFRPTLPRKGYFHVVKSIAPSSSARNSGFDRFLFAKDDLKNNWSNLQDVEVLGFHHWCASRMRIEAIDSEESIVRFTGTTAGTAPWIEFRSGNRYRIENVKESLSEPGQWYLDRPTGELTYIPISGETPENTSVVAPRIDVLVKIESDCVEPTCVEHLNFNGLTFAHTNWQLPTKGQSIPQAEIQLSAAVEGKRARHVRFEGCALRQLGAYGIALRDGCQDNTIVKCELMDLGAGGILIGTIERERHSHSRQTDDNLESTKQVLRNSVRDCTIAHAGRLHPAAVGVWVGDASHNTITHNDIFDLYYTAISVGWQWGYGESRSHHNKVTFNHLHRIGQGVLSDMGAVYTLGISPGTVVSNNWVHDVRSFGYGGWGLYMDEGSTGITMENNLVSGTHSGGFHLHFGRNNRVVNNIFAYGEKQQLQLSKVDELPSFIFERNIVYWDNNSPLFDGEWRRGNVAIDHNIYWRDAPGTLNTLAGMSFTEWRQKTGHDKHSLVDDPSFVDAAAGDFRFRDSSTSTLIGFKPFEYRRAGRETAAKFVNTLPEVPMAFDTYDD